MLHDSDLPKFLWAEAARHAVYLKNRTWTRTIGDATPYELLNGHKPNLGNLHPWGCKVRVHDAGNSKLEGHSQVGRWMGLDADTKDGHRVYWPERQMVTVERSVKFNFESEDVIIGVLPLEGEYKIDERPNETPIFKDGNKTNNVSPDETLIPNDNLPTESLVEGREKRIRKESEYVKLLREGSGVTGQKLGASVVA